MPTVPPLNLTQGQLAWALNLGRKPAKRLLAQLRYLRLKGVPHAEGDVGQGRGNPIRHGFEELIECGVALYAINHGVKPGDIAKRIVDDRLRYRRTYRAAYRALPENILEQPWV